MAMGGNKSAGFTIVETLIVLAVSAMLATSILLVISGRQNKTQFQVAANSLKQTLEQTINEVRNGYYPGSGFSCSGTSSVVISTLSPNDQGTNSTCIFLGKALEFGVGQSSQDPESFATYPLIGLRKSATGTEVLSYTDAKAIALAPGTTINPSFPDDHINMQKTRNGLSLAKTTYHLKGGIASVDLKFGAIAIANTLKSYTYTGSELDSGTQNLDLYYFGPDNSPNWGAIPADSRAVVQGIDTTRHVNDTGNALSSVDFCFDSGGTKQSATLTVTGLGQLSVTLSISSSAC